MSAPRRVVLTGSESVGKTTLAAQLAERFGVEWVPEFVREYAAGRAEPLGFADHGPIAKGQMAREDAALGRARAAGSPLVILDTDLVSTVVYCDHYFGRCPDWIAETARERLADLYLLLGVDVPWVPDGVRDRGDRRDEVQRLFMTRLAQFGAPVVSIAGEWPVRLERAAAAIAGLGVD